MKIYGLDFTSAPSRKKPITCAICQFTPGRLVVDDHLLTLVSLNEFEVFLKWPGPWVAGFDFPFGQPRKLIENLGWPTTWADYVAQIGATSQQAFEEAIAPSIPCQLDTSPQNCYIYYNNICEKYHFRLAFARHKHR